MELHFALRAASGTDTGRLRDLNQDSVLAFVRPPEKGEPMGLFAVADGMGGHKAGEIASKLAVSTIRDSLAFMLEQDESEETTSYVPISSDGTAPTDAEILARRLQIAVENANKAIYDYAKENPKTAGNLGCTVTCAVVSGSNLVIGNVGDSRTYRMSGGVLSQLTNDHSYVWDLVQEGHLESDEIYDHPHRNVITRALGSQEKVPVDILADTLVPGDRLLLCSDGVWEMIRDQSEIAELLQVNELQAAVDLFVEKANYYGGTDNIGVVVVEFGQAPG